MAYSHPQNLTYRNVRYGPHNNNLLNIYLNPVRLSGGNPVMIGTHGGAWSTVDKSSHFENANSFVNKPMFALLLDSVTYGTDDVPFDFVSIEYPAHSHERTLNTPLGIEPIQEGTAGLGTGTLSYPTYHDRMIWDRQQAQQWVADHADEYGFNPQKFASMGHSVGSWVAMCAAFLPTRSKGGAKRFRGQAEGNVRYVFNQCGEVDLDPWVMHHQVTRYCFGLLEDSNANIRDDIERLLLVPDSSGLYPQGQPKTTLCKSLSPVDIVRAMPSSRRGIKIHSFYRLDEDTLSPMPGYATVPPYYAGGHDWHQFAMIEQAFADAGLSANHTGRVSDINDFGGSIQKAHEAEALLVKAELDAVMDF